MKSSDYWKQRFTQLERSQTASSAKASAEVQELYSSAKSEIENRLYAWYGRLAANNGVSMSEARRLLKADELDEFHWSVQQYIKRGKECAVNNQKWFKELENASAKFHITRLEALETNLNANFEILAAQKDGIVSDAVKDAYRTGYYKSCFGVQRGFNVGFDIGTIDEDALNRLIRKPWAVDGYNFSERIWRDKTKLINLTHSELTRSVMLGSSPDKAVKAISKAMDTSLYNAKRLVMTENSYFHALGEQEMYSEFGFDKYEVVAAFDASRKTCELCADMDGKVFLTKDFAPGLNANPFHPNCHCTTVPYFDDDEDDVRFTRLADGKGEYVPSNIRYGEWKKRFVEEGLGENKTQNSITTITSETIAKVPRVTPATYTDEMCDLIQQEHKNLLNVSMTQNNNQEVAFFFNEDFSSKSIVFGEEDRLSFPNLYGKNMFVMHNHPRNSSFSANDVLCFISNNSIKSLSVVKNNGKVEVLTKTSDCDIMEMLKEYNRMLKKQVKQGLGSEYRSFVNKFLRKFEEMGVIEWIKNQ